MNTTDRLKMIRRIRLDMSGIKPSKENFEPLEKGENDPCWENYVQVGTKIVDGKEVPNCIPLEAKKVKEGFPVPSPEGGEDEQTFISRCMSELNEEFPDQSQRAAVCYSKWREK